MLRNYIYNNIILSNKNEEIFFLWKSIGKDWISEKTFIISSPKPSGQKTLHLFLFGKKKRKRDTSLRQPQQLCKV